MLVIHLGLNGQLTSEEVSITQAEFWTEIGKFVALNILGCCTSIQSATLEIIAQASTKLDSIRHIGLSLITQLTYYHPVVGYQVSSLGLKVQIPVGTLVITKTGTRGRSTQIALALSEHLTRLIQILCVCTYSHHQADGRHHQLFHNYE